MCLQICILHVEANKNKSITTKVNMALFSLHVFCGRVLGSNNQLTMRNQNIRETNSELMENEPHGFVFLTCAILFICRLMIAIL